MLSKAHLTSYSRMSGSKWVITPSWLPVISLRECKITRTSVIQELTDAFCWLRVSWQYPSHITWELWPWQPPLCGLRHKRCPGPVGWASALTLSCRAQHHRLSSPALHGQLSPGFGWQKALPWGWGMKQEARGFLSLFLSAMVTSWHCLLPAKPGETASSV